MMGSDQHVPHYFWLKLSQDFAFPAAAQLPSQPSVCQTSSNTPQVAAGCLPSAAAKGHQYAPTPASVEGPFGSVSQHLEAAF